MKVNAFVYGIIILTVFFGVIGGAKAAGLWSVSAKVTATGERAAPTGESVDEIKGWMTLADITKAYKVSLGDIITEFGLPAHTPETAQLKSLESDKFSVTNLRAWISARQQ